QRRRAEVLRRDGARDREDLAPCDRVLEGMGDLLVAELLAVEIALHQRFVGLDHGVEELLAIFGDLVLQLGRDLARPAFAFALRARVGLHVQEVDDTGQLMLGADRQVNGHAARRELVAERLECPEEVGALAVEHVHDDDTREVVLIGALPGAVRLHLDAHDRAHDDERPFDDPQRGDHVALEARVAGGVDQVDLPVLPLDVAERRRQRHLAVVLVVVPVAGCVAGLDAFWLSPFYPSPLADFGYDVSDYTSVDPQFGSLDDFDELVAAAHERGLRILLDLILCHTSIGHPWFREHPDWYIWSPVDGP